MFFNLLIYVLFLPPFQLIWTILFTIIHIIWDALWSVHLSFLASYHPVGIIIGFLFPLRFERANTEFWSNVGGFHDLLRVCLWGYYAFQNLHRLRISLLMRRIFARKTEGPSLRDQWQRFQQELDYVFKFLLSLSYLFAFLSSQYPVPRRSAVTVAAADALSNHTITPTLASSTDPLPLHPDALASILPLAELPDGSSRHPIEVPGVYLAYQCDTSGITNATIICIHIALTPCSSSVRNLDPYKEALDTTPPHQRTERWMQAHECISVLAPLLDVDGEEEGKGSQISCSNRSVLEDTV